MNIKIIDYRPPKIAQLFILVAAVLHWATPLSQLHIYSNQVVGIILGAGGFGVMMWGWWLFKKCDTAICPTARTDRLVTSGAYWFTRNPMYLGVISMLLAVAILVGTFPFYLATVAYFVIINNVFCPYEESKLTEAFGDTYTSYKNRVRRWL
jgi:protein-S-isoprenylcysteine O-methyltransferase Ste14